MDVQSRTAVSLAGVLVLAGVAVAALAVQGTSGMMGGAMGGMMGGLFLAGILLFLGFAVLIGFLVVGASPTVSVAPPPPPPPTMSSPPPAQPASASSVEAAVVRLLAEDERVLYLRMRDAGGTVLQRDVVAWGAFSPAKVTRLLDRLEAKGLVVRERHGATNRIRLLYVR